MEKPPAPSGWYPVGAVLTGLYSDPPLNEVVAPPPGMATRLCFSVEYRHSSEQLMVSLLRLGNLPPRFHGNVTLVEMRLLPDDRRPRQAKARGTGPDPEFNDCFIFQAGTQNLETLLKLKKIFSTKKCYINTTPIVKCLIQFRTLSCVSSTGVSHVCASEHPECVCAECGARR